MATKNGKASASLLLGLLSVGAPVLPFGIVLAILSIPAVVLGILSLKEIRRSKGRFYGKGLAIGGIATGSAGIVVGVVMIVLLASAVPSRRDCFPIGV